MTEPVWLRAAAVVAALAGASEEEAFGAFSPTDREGAARRLAHLRASGERPSVARAIVRERLSLTSGLSLPVGAPGLGARFLARFLWSLSPGERALVARGFDPESTRAVALEARGVRALGPTERATAWWLVATARSVAGRVPGVGVWSEVLAALSGAGCAEGVEAREVERAVRVAGRRGPCAALAEAVRAG